MNKKTIPWTAVTAPPTLQLQWNPDFSNPHVFKPPDNSNQKSFPSPQSNAVILIYPRFLEISYFSNQFSFPLKVPKIGIPLYIIIMTKKKDSA